MKKVILTLGMPVLAAFYTGYDQKEPILTSHDMDNHLIENQCTDLPLLLV